MWQNDTVVDDTAKALELRADVVNHLQQMVNRASPTDLRTWRFHAANEMKYDPLRDASVAFRWPTFFDWHRKPKKFATPSIIRALVDKTGVGVNIYVEVAAKAKMPQKFATTSSFIGRSGKAMNILRSGLRFSLILQAKEGLSPHHI